MSLFNQTLRCASHHFNIRCVSALFAVVALVYILIYLIWSSPASFGSTRGHGSDAVKQHLRHSVLHLNNRNYLDDNTLKVVPDGSGVWVQGVPVQVMSAFHDIYFNQSDNTRFLMPSFVKHSAERDFVCCFSSYSEPQKYVQVQSDIEYVDRRFITEFQNGAFECQLKGKNWRPDLVSFAPVSCQADVTNPLKIIYPKRRKFEFAVCTKVAYGRLDPQRLVEWFEFMREMGASRVISFYTSLHADSKVVFDYYVAQGLLTIIPFKPREFNGVQPIDYIEETAQTRQARQEKTLTVRDCQFRLSGYDFVMTIDFDEMAVPLRPHSSLLNLFEALLEEYKNASAFRMDPILMPPEWNAVRKTNWLYHWRFHTGTYIGGHCIKWIYIPSRVRLVNTHKVYAKPGYETYMIPQEDLHFLHFRTCKAERWPEVECDNLTQSVTNEMSLKRYAGPMSRLIRKMPIEDLIPDEVFVESMRKEHNSYRREIIKR